MVAGVKPGPLAPLLLYYRETENEGKGAWENCLSCGGQITVIEEARVPLDSRTHPSGRFSLEGLPLKVSVVSVNANKL